MKSFDRCLLSEAKLFVAAALARGVLAACSGQMPLESAATPKIVSGRRVSSEDPGFRNTIALVKRNDPSRAIQCSGSVIGRRLILTAAHCLDPHPDLTNLGVMFTNDGDASAAPKIIAVSSGRAAAPSLLDGLPSEAAERVRAHLYPHFDIAWLLIEDDVPEPYEPLPLLPRGLLEQTLVRGRSIWPSGFGQTGTAAPITDAFKRTVETAVSTYHASSHARGLVILKSPGKGICYGDSGGPSYVRVDDRWYIMGVHNGLPPQNFPERGANCEDGVSLVTVPTHFARWIRETSEVDVGENASFDSMAFGAGGVMSSAFGEACSGPRTSFAGWFTFQQILLQGKTHECAWLLPGTDGMREFPLIAKGITDVSPFRHLHAVEAVNLSDNALVDLSDLAAMRSLRSLIVYGNLLPDLSTLKGMSKLTSLHAGNNRLTSLSGVEAMTDLTVLRVPQNRLSDLAPLANLAALRELDLGLNQVSSTAALEGLASLEDLSLRGNSLLEYRGIARLTALKRLSLRKTGIDDLSPLTSLTGLEELWLQENPELTDLSPLRSLTSLKRVYLRATGVPRGECPLPDGVVCDFRQ